MPSCYTKASAFSVGEPVVLSPNSSWKAEFARTRGKRVGTVEKVYPDVHPEAHIPYHKRMYAGRVNELVVVWAPTRKGGKEFRDVMRPYDLEKGTVILHS